MKFEYEYANINGFESQYGERIFESGVPVEAIYVHSKVESDRGNPFIEALPLPRVGQEANCAYEKGIENYNMDDAMKLSIDDKMLRLDSLRNIRFALPFHKDLEIRFYNALLVSYRMREFVFINRQGLKRKGEDEDIVQAGQVLGNPADAANAGFSLIGYSGCGKSTAINTMLSRYPQVIVHKVGDEGYFTQIVYLVVNCVANSNFSALYEGIGAAIDRALGNSQPTYAREIAKTVTLGRKAEKIKGFIDKFGIGAIIFDEIQLIDFNSARENSFDSLLTLVNRTKLSLIVVGTEDAKSKMFKELRTARRVGPVISGDLYCGNRRFFEVLVKSLFKYQWFNEPVYATDDIIDALYDATKGVIDQLISVYTAMHYEYLTRGGKHVKVDADFIRKVAQKYYPEMHSILKNLKDTEYSNNSKEMRALKKAVPGIIDTKEQTTEMTSMVQKFEEKETEDAVLKAVIQAINSIFDYPEVDIKKEYKKITAKKGMANLTEKELAREVIKLWRIKGRERPAGVRQ